VPSVEQKIKLYNKTNVSKTYVRLTFIRTYVSKILRVHSTFPGSGPYLSLRSYYVYVLTELPAKSLKNKKHCFQFQCVPSVEQIKTKLYNKTNVVSKTYVRLTFIRMYVSKILRVHYVSGLWTLLTLTVLLCPYRTSKLEAGFSFSPSTRR